MLISKNRICQISTLASGPCLRRLQYLTCGEGFDAPQELGNILYGHLEAEGVRSERQHLWLLEELTPSARLRRHDSLQG